MPVGWHGHRYARAGESLSALKVDKENTIRAQASAQEWSAYLVNGASVSDLDRIQKGLPADEQIENRGSRKKPEWVFLNAENLEKE